MIEKEQGKKSLENNELILSQLRKNNNFTYYKFNLTLISKYI